MDDKRLKKKKKITAKGSMSFPDYITKLPNSILSSIISTFPVKEAVATSALSRQWRYVWHSLSRLNIDPLRMVTIKKKKQNGDETVEEITTIKTELEKKEEIQKAVADSIPLIDHIFLHQSENVTSCNLVHYAENVSFSNRLIQWIEILKEGKGIKELSLAYKVLDNNALITEDNSFNFPARFFLCKTLHSLKLMNYTLKNGDPFVGCVNLLTLDLNLVKLDDYDILKEILSECTSLRNLAVRSRIAVPDMANFTESLKRLVTLELNLVTINDDTLAKIISNCASLENLIVESCDGLANLVISDDRLKRLELRNIWLIQFKLSMEGLVNLVIKNIFCYSGKVVIDCPNIRVFRAYWDPEGVGKNELSYLIHNKILDQCSGLLEISDTNSTCLPRELYRLPFQYLRELYISYDLNNIKLKILLRYIFCVSNFLRTLDITHQATPWRFVNPMQSELHISWEKMELFDCISGKLRTVRIKGFTGEHLQIDMASYFIKNAAKLDELLIKCNGRCSVKGTIATKELLSLPRASPNARIVLMPSHRFS